MRTTRNRAKQSATVPLQVVHNVPRPHFRLCREPPYVPIRRRIRKGEGRHPTGPGQTLLCLNGAQTISLRVTQNEPRGLSKAPAETASDKRGPLSGARRGIVGGLARWSTLVVRLRWLVIVLSLALTALLGSYTLRNLGVNTDTTGLISAELGFRKNYDAFRKAFPYFNDVIAIVVDGRTADDAQDGASALADRLSKQTDLFKSVFYLQGERFFRDNGLLYLSVDDLTKISTRLAQAQPLLAELAVDPSLRGLFNLFSQAIDALGTKDAQPVQLADVLDRFTAVIAARARGEAQNLSWSTLLAASVDPERDRRRVIVVQARQNFKTLSPAKAAMAEIRKATRELGLTPGNGVRVRLTGGAAIASEELESVALGASLAGYLSLAAVALLLLIGLRSLWLVLAVLVTLVVGLVWTAAFATAAVGSLNLISVAFAVLFIGLGVDFGIHFALRYKEEVDQESSGVTGIANATRAVGGAMTLSAVAAAAAFLSFLPTDYRGLSELGLIAGGGMAIALFCSLTVLPAILAASPVRPARRYRDRRAYRVVREYLIERSIFRHRRGIALTGAVLAVAALIAAPFVGFDRNPLNLKDPTTESVQTAVDLMGDSRYGTGGLSVIEPTRAAANAVAEKLRKLPSVRSVRTIDSFIPKDQAEKLAIIEEMALFLTPVLNVDGRKPPPTAAERRAAIDKLRGTAARVLAEKRAGDLAPRLERLKAALDTFMSRKPDAEALAALDRALTGGFPARLRALRDSLSAKKVTLAGLPLSLREREITKDGRYRVYVLPKHDLRDNAHLRAFVTQVLSVAPTATGGPAIELQSGDVVVGAFAESSVIAFIVIGVMLLLLLRRIRDVMLILATVFMAAAFTVATVVAAGMSFNFANIIVVPLLLGLGVASAIHLVVRARRETGVVLLNTSTPRAILLSALTTLASFGSLAITNHQGTASMGIVLVIALGMTLLCSLVFLPALIDLAAEARPPEDPDRGSDPDTGADTETGRDMKAGRDR